MGPNREQLQKVIASGNDEYNNVLILNLNGTFRLIKGASGSVIGDLNYVTRWETFDSFNDYVGENAAKDDWHIDRVMEWANKAWEEYKSSGKTKIVNMNS